MIKGYFDNSDNLFHIGKCSYLCSVKTTNIPENLGSPILSEAESPQEGVTLIAASPVDGNVGFHEPQMPRNLHPAIKAIVEPFPADRRAVMAVMALPFLGTLAGNARFLYRNQEKHYLGFECCLVGEQGIGKSALTRMEADIFSEVIEEDKLTRAKRDEYDDECLAAGDSKEKKKNPHFAVRKMMPSTTLSEFYQNIKNLKGKRAIIVAPEIDSLNRVGNWSKDGGANERLMFDTETGGQDTKTAAGTSACVPIACNFATSGTPMAVFRHYKNAEDGLVTRIAFCSFPADMDEEAEERLRTEENRAYLVELQKTLLAVPHGDPIEIPQLKKQQLDWCKEQKAVSDASGNKSINTFRKRAAVMGFRAGALLYLLDGKLTRKALDFARWVSDYVLYYQLKYFGDKMNESIEQNAEILHAPVQAYNRNSWVFTQLPEAFSTDDVKTMYEQTGKKATGYRTTIARWEKNGWVENTSRSHFRKTDKGLAMSAGTATA